MKKQDLLRTTMLWEETSSATLLGVAAGSGAARSFELRRMHAVTADIALLCPTPASEWITCRWRLLSSMVSLSAMLREPTPAAAR